MSVQGVCRDHGRLAAIPTGTTPVANLRGDSGQGRQPGDPVLANLFPLITQIVVQFAVAINLAAVSPGMTDQLGLPQIFLGTLA